MDRKHQNAFDLAKTLIFLPFIFAIIDLTFILLMAANSKNTLTMLIDFSDLKLLPDLFLIEFPSCLVYYIYKIIHSKENVSFLIFANIISPIIIAVIYLSVQFYNPQDGRFAVVFAPIFAILIAFGTMVISAFMILAYFVITIPKIIIIAFIFWMTNRIYPKGIFGNSK